MEPITLTNTGASNQRLSACFLPDRGMNLLSLKSGDIEVIDQTTRPLVDKRGAGCGALIGPHFHRRKKEEVALDFDTSLFPHIKEEMTKGADPFSHGIARFAPWKYQKSSTQITATLSGNDKWNGVPLKVLEGQDFNLKFTARLLSHGLSMRYEITSEKPSVIGFHTYYALNGKGFVFSEVEPKYRDQKGMHQVPNQWIQDEHLLLPVDHAMDYSFFPKIHEHDYRFILKNEAFNLNLHFLTPNGKETSCQVWHPESAKFVCVEPISAYDPRNPSLNCSSIEMRLEIYPPSR